MISFLSIRIGPLVACHLGISLLILTTPSRAELPEGVKPAFMKLVQASAGAHQLANQASAQAGMPDLETFLSTIQRCTDATSTRAAVHQRETGRTVVLPRDLPDLLTQGPHPSVDFIEKTYFPAAAEALGKDRTGLAKNVTWRAEADLLLFEEKTTARTICLRPGDPPEETAFSLVHELVHYVKAPTSLDLSKLETFDGLDEYALGALTGPGDEVEAYAFQWGELVRIKGIEALPDPLPKRFFSSSGFIGSKSDLAEYILTRMNYREIRFRHEYARLLQSQISAEEGRNAVFIELINLRTRQEQELRAQLARPAESGAEKVQALYAAANESRKRVLKAALESSARKQKLKGRLEALSQAR